MKKFNLLKYLLLLTLVVALTACEDKNESEFDAALDVSELPWQASTNLDITATEGMEYISLLRDAVTGGISWGNDVVALNVNLASAYPTSEFTNVEFFVTAQEENGYNYTEPFDIQGKSIGSVTAFNPNGSFTFEVNAQELGDIFADDFTKPRNETSIIEGDLFDLHWVITGADGSTMDSRNNPGGDYVYSIEVEVIDVAPPIFEGTFDYEWTYASQGALDWGEIYVGMTGTINISLQNGSFTSYDVDDLSADYVLWGASPEDEVGVIDYDYNSGLVITTGDDFYDQNWNIVKVEGNTLTIDWTFVWSQYGEYGTFTLTRTDGEDWPSNIHSNQ